MYFNGNYAYYAYGMRIQSDFSISAFEPAPQTAEVDVHILEGELPRLSRDPGEHSVDIIPTDEGIFVHWYHYGVFLISEGKRIVIDPYGDPDLTTLKLPLIGCALGLLLHQRGYFTLHASAVQMGSKAIVFMGDKGAGKSTMAGAMHQAGYPLVVDDVLAVDLSTENQVMTLPGFPQIKLWPESVTALGKDLEDLPLLHPNLEKRAMRARTMEKPQMLPVAGFFVLDTGEDISLERLSGQEAFLQLLRYTYVTRYLGQKAGSMAHFKAGQQIIQSTPVYRLRRPRDLNLLPDVISHVQYHVEAGTLTRERRKV